MEAVIPGGETVENIKEIFLSLIPYISFSKSCRKEDFPGLGAVGSKIYSSWQRGLDDLSQN